MKSVAILITFISIVVVAVLVYIVLRSKTDKSATQFKSTDNIMYSQLDITEGFGDNLKLKPEDWIETSPLNIEMDNPESMGLPAKNADKETIYKIAVQMSEIRESILLENDGVYCPICHIANIDIKKLRKPCPKCNREFLKFGWD